MLSINSNIIKDKMMSAEDAADIINHGDVLGTSGFTPSGYPKVVPIALAKKAKKLHREGEPFKVTLCTGASVGDELDGELARASAIKKRLPFQSNNDLRKQINNGEVEFVDLHLSDVASYMRQGFIEKCSVAIIEAVFITDDGKIYLTMSGGMSATFASIADKIIIELNESLDDKLIGIHDVFIPPPPPHRTPLPIFHPWDRFGFPYIQVDPKKIIAVVKSDKLDTGDNFKKTDKISKIIAENVMDFLTHEEKKGRIPKNLPYQSGVGNLSNAVLECIAEHPSLEPISMYTEVVQDSIFHLIDSDRLLMASTSALTFSPSGIKRFLSDIDYLKSKFLIRQQEMSNNPEVIRRLGVISINTALELDIFGNVNSTHLLGSKIVNGIGGSGDFCRNAYTSIFIAPSTVKNDLISTIVPMVTHVDHNEHSVKIIATEQGVADLRGLCPTKRAEVIIENCAHPNYKHLLKQYLKKSSAAGHTPFTLKEAFSFHERFIDTGRMSL